MGDTARSVFYYFAEFKPAHREQYADYDENKAGAAYAEELFLQACGNEADSCFGDGFPLLERNTATALDRLICFREDSLRHRREHLLRTRDIPHSFRRFFRSLDSQHGAILAENYRPYAELQESFASSARRMIGVRTAELCLAYASGILLCFLGLPIVPARSIGRDTSDGRTLHRPRRSQNAMATVILLRTVFAGRHILHQRRLCRPAHVWHQLRSLPHLPHRRSFPRLCTLSDLGRGAAAFRSSCCLPPTERAGGRSPICFPHNRGQERNNMQAQKMRYKAVIFDLDGVLVHTDEYHYLAWKQLCDLRKNTLRQDGERPVARRFSQGKPRDHPLEGARQFI